MTTTLTNRDALVVLVIGSSNSTGNGAATAGQVVRTLTTNPYPRTYIWGRWLAASAQDRSNPGAGPYDWASITDTADLFSQNVSPVYSLAEQYGQRFFPSNKFARQRSSGNYSGSPKGVYFIQYSASSARATMDAHDVSPGASLYPKAPNTSTNTAFETFIELYVNEGLANLQNDPDIDRVFIDCMYVIANESAGYAATEVFAYENTPLQLVPGMSLMHSEVARRVNLSAASLVEITVKPSVAFAEFVSSDTSRIPEVRTRFDEYEAASQHPLVVVDGSMFDVDTRTEGRSQALTVSGASNEFSYDDVTKLLTIVQAAGPAAVAFSLFAPTDILEFDINAGAVAGVGRVSSVTSATEIVLDLDGAPYGFTTANPGTVANSTFTGAGSLARSTVDAALNHYSAQGILQMGEALFLARQTITGDVAAVKAPSDGFVELPDIG